MSQLFRAQHLVAALVLILATGAWMAPVIRAERVGYVVKGDFFKPTYPSGGPQPVDFVIFGKHIPFNSKFSGTFTYETTADGNGPFSSEPNVKDFKQKILGGFTLDVFNNDRSTRFFRLLANEYTMRVTNDHTVSGTPVASDLLSVEFDTTRDPALPPILKDGSPYLKPTVLSLPISWDSSTFSDPNEPVLHNSLPPTPFVFPGFIFAGGSAALQVNWVSPIDQSAGDYNLDDTLDKYDRDEWRRAFGNTGDMYSYADGNHDGVIDGADYVIWRRASDAFNAVRKAAIPEPSTLAILTTGLLVLSAVRRKRFA